ncbi:SIR2 family protein [Exiguobacterium mexicanum]|uniref:SIR2 family protein n=1 Tax=Exiguobacterium mexicanum TaxID=340146 RepID=A0ABT7MNM3_9BACL|nr:SIR2 family protein [Exiguobacterium mexicanum]MDL5376809.1 SIR2 family protein [Exiguobacterium mexicanum]
MDDKMVSLSFSMESNKGVYALLLGSGVSYSAGIPTGWHILETLCGRLMKVQGSDKANAIEWYEEKYGKQPAYDEVIELLAKTSSDRNGLLREFFEPSKDDQEHGLKVPTQAHKAIAELVHDGFIKVIVTTNFDRLMEQALDALSVQYQTLYHDSDIEGMRPLTHAECTIIKVHGDYRDMRFKNITDELKEYSPELKGLLKQVFNDYGMIVSGWSAEWDTALKHTIRSVVGRRYSWYWHNFNEYLNPAAHEVVEFRDAHVIVDNKGADNFFYQLKENVLSISQNKKLNPDTLAMKISRLKKLLSQNRTIEINDFITNETKLLIDKVKFYNPNDRSKSSDELIIDWIPKIEEQSKELVSLLTVIAYYNAEAYESLLVETLERLTTMSESNGIVTLLKVKILPLQYIFYGVGMALVKSSNFNVLKKILTQPNVRNRSYQSQSFAEYMSPYNGLNEMARVLDKNNSFYLPFEELVMRPFILKNLLETNIWIDDHELDASYDIFEFLRTMYEKSRGTGRNYLYGRFAYRRENEALKNLLIKGKEEKDIWNVLELFERNQSKFKIALRDLINTLQGQANGDFIMASLILNTYFSDED